MSRKNKPLEKKARALERAIRKGRVPTVINLIEWLKDRNHAQTTGEAVRLIKDGRVKSESHVLNGDAVIEINVGPNLKNPGGDTKRVRIFNPLVPSSLRSTIEFVES